MTGRLSGRVVATTRDGDPDDPLTAALLGEGAVVREWPTLAFADPADPRALGAALEDLGSFDWVAFTSSRAVAAVARLRPWPGAGPRVAAVGDRTAKRLRGCGWPVDVVGDRDGAAGLVRALTRRRCLEGARVLFPCGSLAGPELEVGLRAAGAVVRRVEAYQTLIRPPDSDLVRGDLARGVHVVIFTSPSAVQGLATALRGDLTDALAGCAAVAAGPTTASALAEAALDRAVVAERPIPERLVDACVRAVETS